jgi:imidazole glycerol-phosphate synthase subunit HisH
MQTISIIDYGMGNLRSVAKALDHVSDGRALISVTSDPDAVARADRVVFPGQGAARDCMRELNQLELAQAVREAAATKPFLGICMGMQILAQYSEEDEGVECLGLIEGKVKGLRAAQAALDAEARYKLPHMGWNEVQQMRPHPLWQGIQQNARFYFVHSYYLDPADRNAVAATTSYGAEFPSAIAAGNVFAIQCHPEKSAASGLTLLNNFLRWDGMG